MESNQSLFICPLGIKLKQMEQETPRLKYGNRNSMSTAATTMPSGIIEEDGEIFT